MKTIGILTFHNGMNYGATLQNFALKKYLNSKKDLNVETINFNKKKVYGKAGKYLSKAYVGRLIYSIPYRKQLNTKKNEFENFIKNNINVDTEDIVKEENIENKVLKYDAIFFGSDQIWNMNPKIYDRSKCFFGDFNYNGIKLAYSASFGDNLNFAIENKSYIIEKLKEFKKISVRENSGKEFLQKEGIDSDVTVDPTMLLDKEYWEKIAGHERIIKEKYILYYSVNCKRYSWEIAKKLSKKTGIKVINLEAHPKIIGSKFVHYYSQGPIGFLNIVKNAEYIVTNSFHGTVFSIIFNKPFIPVFEIDKCGNIISEERKETLLKSLELSNLMHTKNSKINIELLNSIDYKKVNSLKNDLIDKSKKYIKTCIDLIEKGDYHD